MTKLIYLKNNYGNKGLYKEGGITPPVLLDHFVLYRAKSDMITKLGNLFIGMGWCIMIVLFTDVISRIATRFC